MSAAVGLRAPNFASGRPSTTRGSGGRSCPSSGRNPRPIGLGGGRRRGYPVATAGASCGRRRSPAGDRSRRRLDEMAPRGIVADQSRGVITVTRHSPWSRSPALLAVLAVCATGLAQPEDFVIHTFDRQQLTDEYYSEGIGAGDLNRDGHVRRRVRPLLVRGAEVREEARDLPAETPEPRRVRRQLLRLGLRLQRRRLERHAHGRLPRHPGLRLREPARRGACRHWPQARGLRSVGNESPQFTNIVGDERPELVCTRDGFFGYATIEPGPAVRGVAVPPDLRQGRPRSRSGTGSASAT